MIIEKYTTIQNFQWSIWDRSRSYPVFQRYQNIHIMYDIDFYYSVFDEILEEKFSDLHKELDFKIPEMEYLISMWEHFKINPRREPYLMWIIRLSDYMPLPREWYENIGNNDYFA